MKVVSVRTLDEALHLLRDAGPDARVLAGGTDLMVEMESGRTRPASVVDVWRLDALRGIRATSEGLEIGALTTCTEMLRSADVRAGADILVDAARLVGAVQIQNRATLGGNLGTASPAADLVPVLFALDARVKLVSGRGERTLAVTEFVHGYRATARAHDELIAAVVIPRPKPGERRAFRKVGTRKAQSIAKVVVAVSVRVDDGGTVGSARIAAGSVADRTLMLDGLAGDIVGRKMSGGDELSRLCAAGVAKGCSPRDDVRSTAEYRRFALARLLERMLDDLGRRDAGHRRS